MFRILLLSFVLSHLVLGGNALAAKQPKLSEVRLQPQQFSEYRARIEDEMTTGESLAQMTTASRSEVRAILARMEGRLSGVQSIEQMPENTRRELFNDQERLRVLLGQAEEDSRLICTREKTIGSNRARTTCITVAERRRQSEASRDSLRRGHSVDNLEGVD